MMYSARIYQMKMAHTLVQQQIYVGTIVSHDMTSHFLLRQICIMKCLCLQKSL